MNTLKKLIIGLVVLALLVFIVTLFLPSDMHLQRTKEIEAPVALVFNQVNKLENWEKWSPWLKMDSEMVLSYSEQKSGTGASYSWTSPNGPGALTIKESVAGKLIKNEIDFGPAGMGYGTWNFEPSEKGTKVSWIFDAEMGSGPINKLKGLMMDRIVGSSMEEGLESIASISTNVTKVEEVTVPGTFALTYRATCKMNEISQQLGESYGAIMAALQVSGAEMTAQPFAIYHNWDERAGTVDIEAGIPIDIKVEPIGEVNAVEFPASNTVAAHYYGDYPGVGDAHDAIDTYVLMKGKKVTGPPWEQYITDPGVEPDTSKWLTMVYYPIN